MNETLLVLTIVFLIFYIPASAFYTIFDFPKILDEEYRLEWTFDKKVLFAIYFILSPLTFLTFGIIRPLWDFISLNDRYFERERRKKIERFNQHKPINRSYYGGPSTDSEPTSNESSSSKPAARRDDRTHGILSDFDGDED